MSELYLGRMITGIVRCIGGSLFAFSAMAAFYQAFSEHDNVWFVRVVMFICYLALSAITTGVVWNAGGYVPETSKTGSRENVWD